MSDTYVFRYRRTRSWSFTKIVATGHAYQEAQDKMIVYLPDGGLIEIAEWKTAELRLGVDWALAAKRHMEAQAGREIPTNNIKHD